MTEDYKNKLVDLLNQRDELVKNNPELLKLQNEINEEVSKFDTLEEKLEALTKLCQEKAEKLQKQVRLFRENFTN